MDSSNSEINQTDSPPEVLYHYTDQNGLLGILETSEIWATKIQYLNDISEFRLALDIAAEFFKEKNESSVDNIRRKAFSLWSAIESWQDINVMVCSLSKQRDSLSQWRAYGGKNSGFSIGFYTDALSSLAIKNKFVLKKCIYDLEDQKRMVKKLVDSAMRQELSLHLNEFMDLVDPKLKELTNNFMKDLVRLAPILKNIHFRSEEEWRLISEPQSYYDGRFAFRKGISMVTPYYKFPLASENEILKIKEIVIGPTPHLKLARSSVEMLLRKKGLNQTEIIESDVPLRNY